MDLITSLSNPKIKSVRSLQQSPERRRSGLFIVEGIRHVGEAIEAATAGVGIEISSLFYAPELLESEYAGKLIRLASSEAIPCYAATADVFNSISGRENPQGILAVVGQPKVELQTLNPTNFPWGVALVAPQDPGNIGTIMRTIDAVASSGLILLDGGAEPYHPSSIRASMGTLFWYPMVSNSFEDFTSWTRQHGYVIYGTSAHAEEDYREVAHFKCPMILLLGSEREGLTADQRGICDKILRIPMKGKATSLNLAVSAGVVLYRMLEKNG
jgi:TrmH family RNA methyltransferase